MKTKAAVLYETGKPLVIVDDLEIPEPGKGQVLVNISSSGICRSQLMETQGCRGHDRFLPHLLGHEGSGVVEAIGEGVQKLRAGDRVVLTWIKGQGADIPSSTCTHGSETINAGAVTTFSHHALVSENRCVPLDVDIPPDVASLLGCAIPTGAGIVLNTMKPNEDDSLLIIGLGGIGMSALLGAVLRGCSPIIGVDPDPDKLELARQLGATHTIDPTAENLEEAARVIVADGGVDFSIEAAGRTETIEQAFGLVRDNGGLCIFASHPPAGDTIRLDPHLLIRGKQIRGSWGGDTDPDQDIPFYARKFAEGQLPLDRLVTHRFPLEDINEALALLESGRAGRIVIDMDPTEAAP
jgi:S-(hydroxymethyl)glutathione dehydrogenase/alcohol dehydrogenase